MSNTDAPCSMTPKPFAEPLFRSQSSIDDVCAVIIDAFFTTHYMHTNFPSVLQDTLSPRDIKFRRTESQQTVCVLVDLDGHEHLSNPGGRPSPHGTVPFNAYDKMLDLLSRSTDCSEPNDAVNSAAPYPRYRHVLEGLFYILLWCISVETPKQTRAWIRGYGCRPLLLVMKHRKEREAFMWDPSQIFATIRPECAPLVQVWLRPLWLLLSEAHFACRSMTGEERAERLDSMLTFDRVVNILRAYGGVSDLRIATLVPLPGCHSDEEL
ncbi:hypothetical protein B0H12DRAFT_1325838 [Mycena haematopus]|nr:hypothetical protein B0H12DRAFT_1325838 [Mycena haematopus]